MHLFSRKTFGFTSSQMQSSSPGNLAHPTTSGGGDFSEVVVKTPQTNDRLGGAAGPLDTSALAIALLGHGQPDTGLPQPAHILHFLLCTTASNVPLVEDCLP